MNAGTVFAPCYAPLLAHLSPPLPYGDAPGGGLIPTLLRDLCSDAPGAWDLSRPWRRGLYVIATDGSAFAAVGRDRLTDRAWHAVDPRGPRTPLTRAESLTEWLCAARGSARVDVPEVFPPSAVLCPDCGGRGWSRGNGPVPCGRCLCAGSVVASAGPLPLSRGGARLGVGLGHFYCWLVHRHGLCCHLLVHHDSANFFSGHLVWHGPAAFGAFRVARPG